MKYRIEGDNLPVVICELEAGESLNTEKGAMAWMTPNMEMSTSGKGGLGKSIGRMFAGESIFMNTYTAKGSAGEIAFASSFPGSIKALDISEKSVVIQKSAFLAAEANVELSIFFREKLGTGFFGGEGFIMQKLTGSGMAFVEIDGAVVEYDLAAGESMIIDTGYLAYMDITCSMNIQRIKGMKNMLLGGEGMFNTVVTGPGKIGVQTMPVSNVANLLAPFIAGGK